MVDDSHQNAGAGYWGYLIKSDRTATPMLEQLCIGLTRIIRKLGPGPEYELTPERLATFYRSVGGNFDSLFLKPSETGPNFNPGLSFLYRTLGCYHSLEPTPNAFETPSVPCLTPAGFVRWQTIQLLLDPDEHAAYLQEAVRIYNVPRTDGRTFPKTIPRDSFPRQPDAAMEKWHSQITSQLNQDYMRRLKNSPYVSPKLHGQDRADGYFGSHIPSIRRTSRNSKERSSEEDVYLRPMPDHRRSSEPFILSPLSAGSHNRPPSSYLKDERRRSQSTQRHDLKTRPRSATTEHKVPHQQSSSSSQQRGGGDLQNRRASPYSQRLSPHARQYDNRRRSASAEHETSGEEASSEDSDAGRKRNRHKSSPRSDSKRRSLFPPSLNPFSHKRRHSHDALPTSDKSGSRKRREDAPSVARIAAPEAPFQSPRTVQFRNSMHDRPVHGVPGSPVSATRNAASHRTATTVPHTAPLPGTGPSTGYPLAREISSGSSSDPRSGYDSHHSSNRNSGVPLRVSTVSGVGGRRYASAEPQSAGATLQGTATPQQDPRARYSVIA